jgi:cytochrome c biogenesis protein CcdA
MSLKYQYLTWSLKIAGFIFCALLFLIPGVCSSESGDPAVPTADPGAVHFFYSPTCGACHKVIPFIEEYEAAHPDILIQYHNIGDNPDDILLFNTFKTMHPDIKLFVPSVFLGTQVLIGEQDIFSEFESSVEEFKAHGLTSDSPDLSAPAEPITINPMILLLAALGEGFNPCGLLVLALLMVSLMASDSRKTILLVGSAYIIAFFLIRVLSGFAIFSVIQIPGVAHLFLIAAGVIAIIAGLFQIKDGLLREKKALFSIPQSKKSSISKYLKIASVPAGFIVGALTGLYGMACTVGIYISILGMIYQDFQSGIFYLLAYNFVVILPLVAILLLVLFGLSPEKLNSWRDERKSLLRLIIGVIMLIMGIIILVPIFF